MGDFNCKTTEITMINFCHNLKNLISDPTCFKIPLNPSSIDVMLTNKPRSFYNSNTVETGVSDHHRMTISIMKTFFPKQAYIQVITYRDYKFFNEDNFRRDLQNHFVYIGKDAIFLKLLLSKQCTI